MTKRRDKDTRGVRRSGARAARAPVPADEAPRLPGRPVGSDGDRTRERIVAAALQTFADQGFAGTSVRDIAKKARIRVSSLYHYFPSKESLYQEVIAKMQGEMRDLVLSVMSKGLDLRELSRETMGKLFDFFLAHPTYARLGFRDRLDGGVPFDRRTTDRWLGLMDGLMQPAQMRGVLKDLDPALLIVTVDGLVHWHTMNNTFYRAMLGKGVEDPEIARRAREHVIQVVLRAVGLD